MTHHTHLLATALAAVPAIFGTADIVHQTYHKDGISFNQGQPTQATWSFDAFNPNEYRINEIGFVMSYTASGDVTVYNQSASDITILYGYTVAPTITSSMPDQGPVSLLGGFAFYFSTRGPTFPNRYYNFSGDPIAGTHYESVFQPEKMAAFYGFSTTSVAFNFDCLHNQSPDWQVTAQNNRDLDFNAEFYFDVERIPQPASFGAMAFGLMMAPRRRQRSI